MEHNLQSERSVVQMIHNTICLVNKSIQHFHEAKEWSARHAFKAKEYINND